MKNNNNESAVTALFVQPFEHPQTVEFSTANLNKYRCTFPFINEPNHPCYANCMVIEPNDSIPKGRRNVPRDAFADTFIVINSDSGHYSSLTNDQKNALTKRFWDFRAFNSSDKYDF